MGGFIRGMVPCVSGLWRHLKKLSFTIKQVLGFSALKIPLGILKDGRVRNKALSMYAMSQKHFLGGSHRPIKGGNGSGGVIGNPKNKVDNKNK